MLPPWEQSLCILVKALISAAQRSGPARTAGKKREPHGPAFFTVPDSDYFIRYCLNQFNAGVEAPWKPLT